MSLILPGASYLTLGSVPVSGMPLTIEAWYEPLSLAAEACVFSLGNNVASTNYYTLLTEVSGIVRAQQSAAGTAVLAASAAGAVSVGTWAHLVAVFASATSRTIYVNGVAVSNTTSNSPGSISRCGVGALWNNTSPNSIVASGKIGYVTVRNIALSSTDVANLYNAGAGIDPRNVQGGSIVLMNDFEGSTPWTEDISGTQYVTTGTPTTGAGPFNIGPSMSVQAATNVLPTSATLNGTILETGGVNPTVQGFQYGLTTGYGSDVHNTGSYGTGAFAIGITGLTPGTTYHYRSYATNSVGTIYSADQTFTVPDVKPALASPFADLIGSTTVRLNAIITAVGSGNPTIEGFSYGLTTGYGSDVHNNGSFSAGPFSISLTGLTPGTTYHFQAYATNANGTGTTVDGTFTTATAGFTTYYIDAITPGSDSNNGTSTATPWATLAHADATLPANYGSVYLKYPDGNWYAIAPVWHGFLSYYPFVMGSDSTAKLYDVYNGWHTNNLHCDPQWNTSGRGVYFPNTATGKGQWPVNNWTGVAPTAGGAFIVSSKNDGAFGETLFSLTVEDATHQIAAYAPFSDGTVQFIFGNPSTGKISYAQGSLAGQWHTWGFLAGGSYQAIYLDGTLKTSAAANQTYAYATGSTNLWLGYQNVASPHRLQGSMQSIMIKNSTLADADYLTLQSWLNTWEIPYRVPQSNPVNVPDVGSLSPTPPMGYNSWLTYHNGFTDALMRSTADAMVSKGLLAAGYKFINPDGAWSFNTPRDGSGNIAANATNFPSGMAPPFAYIQSKGITPALYMNPGPGNGIGCSSGPGSEGNETKDVALLASLGVGMLKYDNCDDFITPIQHQYAYRAMGLALQANPSTANCLFMVSDPQFADGTSFGANCANWFKLVGGIEMYSSHNLSPLDYTHIMTSMDFQLTWTGLSGPGKWFESDGLPVGVGSNSDAEGRTYMALYCLMSMPLWVSCDVINATAATIATITNRDAISVNQDTLGLNGNRYSQVAQGGGNVEVWAKQMTKNRWAVAVINRTTSTQTISATWSMFGSSSAYYVRDIWASADLGYMGTGISPTVATHDVAMYILTPPATVPNLVGLSQGGAASSLASVLLNLGNVSYQQSSSTAGTVISQSVAGGTVIQQGSSVDVVLSSGSPSGPSIGVGQVGTLEKLLEWVRKENSQATLRDTNGNVYRVGQLLKSIRQPGNNIRFASCELLNGTRTISYCPPGGGRKLLYQITSYWTPVEYPYP